MEEVVILNYEDRKEIREGAELLRYFYFDKGSKEVKDFINKLFLIAH